MRFGNEKGQAETAMPHYGHVGFGAHRQIAGQSDEIDIAHLIEALWQARLKIVAAVIISIGIAMILAFLITPQYESTAQILIENQDTSFTQPASNTRFFNQNAIDELSLGSEIQIITSRDLAELVIDRLNLHDLSEFNPSLQRPGLIQGLLMLMGGRPDPESLSQRDRVYRQFADKLLVYPIARSRVITISFRSQDPQLAAQIVQMIVTVYTEFSQNASRDNTRNATLWLEEQIEDLREKVSIAENKVAQYRADTDLMTGLNDTRISAQQMSELSTQLTRSEAERSQSDARADQIRALLRAGSAAISIPEILNSPLIQRLQEQEVTLRARIAELSATLLPRHPRIIELRAQLNDLSQQIREEALRVARGYENEARIAQARSDALRAQLDGLKSTVSQAESDEVELRSLEREATAQRDLLEAYLARYRDAIGRNNAGNLPSDVKLIQRPSVSSTAIFPKTFAMIVIAFLGSLILSMVFVLALALLRPAKAGHALPPSPVSPDPASPSPHERRVSNKPVGKERRQSVKPKFTHPAYASLTAAQSHSFFEESVQKLSVNDARSLRHLSQLLRKTDYQNIAVVAAKGALSASDVVLCTARTQALEGDDIILVEANIHEPDQRFEQIERLGRGLKPGLSEFLNNQAGFEACIHDDTLSSMHIIPQGLAETPSLEQLASNQMRDAFKDLSDSYHRIFIDAGLMGDKALAMIARSDICLIVTRDGVSDHDMNIAQRAVGNFIDKNQIIIVEAPSWQSNEKDSFAA